MRERIDIAAEKDTIRQEALRVRTGINNRSDATLKIYDNFFDYFDLTAVEKDYTVSAYWAKNTELDCFAVMEKLLNSGINTVLPITREKNSPLSFSKWDFDTKLQKGKFGIMEPVIKDNENNSQIEPDMLLVPLLAFDRYGNRIGYGGGFFDATIRCLRQKKPIISVGIAYDEQLCLFKLPTEEYDQKLDAVITPSRTYKW